LGIADGVEVVEEFDRLERRCGEIVRTRVTGHAEEVEGNLQVLAGDRARGVVVRQGFGSRWRGRWWLRPGRCGQQQRGRGHGRYDASFRHGQSPSRSYDFGNRATRREGAEIVNVNGWYRRRG